MPTNTVIIGSNTEIVATRIELICFNPLSMNCIGKAVATMPSANKLIQLFKDCGNEKVCIESTALAFEFIRI